MSLSIVSLSSSGRIPELPGEVLLPLGDALPPDEAEMYSALPLVSLPPT